MSGNLPKLTWRRAGKSKTAEFKSCLTLIMAFWMRHFYSYGFGSFICEMEIITGLQDYFIEQFQGSNEITQSIPKVVEKF